MTENNGLDTSTKEKPVMNVDDIFRVLHHHWARDTSTFPDGRQSLQLAFLILICAYTASRPGALVYVKRNAKVVTQCALETYDEDRAVGDGTSDDEIDDGDGDDDGEDEDDSEMDNQYNGISEGSEEKDEPIDTLCYKHVTLILIREPGAERDLIAMEIDLRFTKGYRRNSKR